MRVMAAIPEYPDPSALGHEAARDLGIALLDAQAKHDALPYLERAVELRPGAHLLVRLGSALRDLNQPHEALPRYEAALTLEGAGAINAHARIGIAAVLGDMGELQDLANGIEVLKTVFDADPADVAAHWTAHVLYRKAHALTGLEDFGSAAERHKEAAVLLDERSEEDRRSEQRLRAVQAQRLPVVAVPRSAARAAKPPGPSEPEADDGVGVWVALRGLIKRLVGRG